MGINCHIMIETPEEQENPSICYGADVRWSSHDGPLREILGIPAPNSECWEHLENHEYQLVFDACMAHRAQLWKEREALHEQERDADQGDLADIRMQDPYLDAVICRTEEWMRYYEIAAVLVQLGHKVVCYGV